jgi:hypothetical protein
MSQYLLSVWHDTDYEVDFSSDAMQRTVAQVSAYNDELQAAGAWVFGNGLMPASTASVARFANGEVSVTDGPFAESKEQIGGFWVIEAADDAAAREWALKASAACEGPVEVRPFQPG